MNLFPQQEQFCLIISKTKYKKIKNLHSLLKADYNL